MGPHPSLEGRGSGPCRRAWVGGELRWKGGSGGGGKRKERDDTEGVMHVTYVETLLPPNDNGRVLYQD